MYGKGDKVKRRILIIASHPDDEIIGCGGTVRRLVNEGYEAFTLILGEGITSRDRKRDKYRRQKEIEELKHQANKANHVIGVNKVFISDFPDNRFDSVSLLDIIKTIENVKNDVKPNIIFTHHERDLNIDHQLTYKAVITATRPISNESVKEIYSFEILSSTEWSYPCSFSPDMYFDISDTLEFKLRAMEIYKSELKEFPHPRSLEGIRLNSNYLGMRVGLLHAEVFKTVRIIR